MSIDLFLTLLFSSTIVTIILTDALKKLLNASETPYRANAVVLDSAMVASTGVSVIYRIPFGLGFDYIQLFRLLVLIVCTWLMSMITYDKLVQFKYQHKKAKERNEKAKQNEVV